MLSLIERVAGKPWMIDGDIAAHVRGLVSKHGIGALRDLAWLKKTAHAYQDEPQAAARSKTAQGFGSVAVIPIIGTLTQRGDIIDSVETRSTAAVADEVMAAVMEPKVDSVVLEIDSGGGEVFGTPEAFAAIRQAARIKPVVASVNSFAASAAYYLASAANEIMVTPSGQLGSIGVYTLHVDMSQALEAMGERWSFISAGKFKVEGNPAEPLGDEARANMQARVDGYYDMFVRDVARGRKVSVETVRTGFGEGRTVGAAAAVKQRMADSIGTLEQAIRRAADLGRERRQGPVLQQQAEDDATELVALEPAPAPVLEAADAGARRAALARLRGSL